MSTKLQSIATNSSINKTAREKLLQNIWLAEADAQDCLKRYENASTLVQYLYTQFVTLEQELRLLEEAEGRLNSMMTRQVTPLTRASKAIPILPPSNQVGEKHQDFPQPGRSVLDDGDAITVNVRSLKDITGLKPSSGSKAVLSESMKEAVRNLVVMVAVSKSI